MGPLGYDEEDDSRRSSIKAGSGEGAAGAVSLKGMDAFGESHGKAPPGASPRKGRQRTGRAGAGICRQRPL